MTRRQILEQLRALRRERAPYLIRQHADALQIALGEPWVDAVLAREVNAALAPLEAARPWTAHPLRVGETYLLLCDPGVRRGEVVRWQSSAMDGTVRFTAECEAALDRAWRGLLSTVSTEGHALPPGFVRGGLEAPDLADAARVEGESLGVAAGIAWLSRACDAAPRDDTAASAELRSDGSLGGVKLLAEKVAALRERWPSVTRVVVSDKQKLEGELPREVDLVWCAHFRDAFKAFGLSLEKLPGCSIETHVRRVADFQLENTRSQGTEAWRELSSRAWATAEALTREDAERSLGERARAWAALFALHAGDGDSARDMTVALREPEDPSVRAWLDVVGASAAIDKGLFEEARTRADAAVRMAPQLPPDFRWIEGHARGTRGRALLHAGKYVEAEVMLRETVHWFIEGRQPWEAARTSKELATCLRLVGRAPEALEIVARAFDYLDQARGREVSSKTRDFLKLEHGRCLLAVGRPDEALAAFEFVMRAQTQDHDYPRLGALRGLVVANRRLGRAVEAREALDRCLRVASTRSPGDALGRAAVIAAAEALADEDDDALGRAREAWTRHFPEQDGEPAMRAALGRQVY